MNLYKKSTKTRPLLFFETFINNKALIMFEDMFYNNQINPSQEIFKKEGYIKYFKDSYEDEPFVPVVEYFEEKLKHLMKNEILITNLLLAERRDELEYENVKSDIFIQKQLTKIEVIKANCESLSICKNVVLEAIVTLEKNIKETTGHIIQPKLRVIAIKTNKPFFEPKIKRSKLIKLYDIAIENKIVDEDIVSQETFLEVFTANNPKALENKIIFFSDNQISTFFLNTIIVLFDNLSHSQISKSESFYNRKKKLLNLNDLDKAKSLYEKKERNKVFLNIEKDIESLK